MRRKTLVAALPREQVPPVGELRKESIGRIFDDEIVYASRYLKFRVAEMSHDQS